LIQSDQLRGHIDVIILRLIIEKDRYGYEILNEIKERSNSIFEIKEATLYSVLKRLLSKEIISSYVGEKTHGSKRRYYQITPLGKAFYKQQLLDWNELKTLVDSLLEDDHETNS
jgi:PadR family transcriptional regulator PadR